MLRIYAGNLPSDCTEADLTELFSAYGRVRSTDLPRDLFTRRCRGFGFVEMEGHEARAAVSGLDGQLFRGNNLRVNLERPRTGKAGRHRR